MSKSTPIESNTQTQTTRNIVLSYISYLALFIGTAFISGAIVHSGEVKDIPKYIVIGIIGIVLFLAGSFVQEFVLNRDNLRQEGVVKFFLYSLLLSIGIGMVSGGVQHFTDYPVYSSYLIPIGLILSLVAYLLKNNYHITKKLWGIITATFVLIAIPLYFGLSVYAQSLESDAKLAKAELCANSAAKPGSLLDFGSLNVLASPGHLAEPICVFKTKPQTANPSGSMTEIDHGSTVKSKATSKYTIKNLNQDPIKPNLATKVKYQILDSSNQPLKDYAIVHAKPMHLIIAKTDLSQFLHIHPSIDADGTWNTEANFPVAGDYKLFADFTPTNQSNQTVNFELTVGDPKNQKDLPLTPDTGSTKAIDGYQVKYILPTKIEANQEFEYSLEITKNGQKVSLEDYLGAKGHSVILKEATLEYAHTHPINNSELRFATTLSAGKSKIFTQFQIAGKVLTADYTLEVAPGQTPKASADHDSDGHQH